MKSFCRSFVRGLIWLSAALSSAGLTRAADSSADDGPLPPGAKEVISPLRVRVADLSFKVSDIAERWSPITTKASGLAGAFDEIIARNEAAKALVEHIQVAESETELRITMESDVLFDFDSAEIKPAAVPALKGIGDFLLSTGKPTAKVIGHTDSKGNDTYNDKLSLRRAQSVSRWFVKEAKLGRVKFDVTGRGEREPRAPNTAPDGEDDPAGRTKNRRVEIVVRK